MTDRPKFLARMTGLFFLITLLTGIFAQGFVAERLIVHGDAAATAGNVLANRGLYEAAFTVYMVEMACQIAMTVLFYVLLRPVNKGAALLAMTWGLTGCGIKTAGRVFFLAPLFLLGGGANAHYLGVFRADQLQALSLLFLTFNDRAAGMSLAFFGFCDALNGWLMIRSTFLPRWLGALSIICALGWTTFVSPTLGYHLINYLAVLGLLGSVAMIGWLLVKGVNEERWKEQNGLQA